MFQKMTIIYFLLVPVQNDKLQVVSSSDYLMDMRHMQSDVFLHEPSDMVASGQIEYLREKNGNGLHFRGARVILFKFNFRTRTKAPVSCSGRRTLPITQSRSRNAQDRDNHERFARLAAGRRRRGNRVP